MTVWAHFGFSQRPTWPPSAAVRQRSIADMTFIWPRLTWPALALRHAAPWSRKISATSSNRRDMAAMRSAGLCCPSLWLSLAFLGFLRGCDSRSSGLSMPAIRPVATRVRRRVQFVVTQQCLDDSDISVVFEQVGREAVPQRMQRHVLLDPGRVGCLVEQAA